MLGEEAGLGTLVVLLAVMAEPVVVVLDQERQVSRPRLERLILAVVAVVAEKEEPLHQAAPVS
jgi:hypothetical protein